MNTDKIFAESIANEYAPKNSSKVVALKKLDFKAKCAANIFAYTFGTLMALVLGVGMCFSMGVLGDGSQTMLAVGVIVGVLGLVGVGVNYPSTGNCLKMVSTSMPLKLSNWQKKSVRKPNKRKEGGGI